MNNSIKQTQLILLMVLVIAGGKFLSLPGLMAQFAGRDSWISMTLLFVIDLVCLCFVLWAIKLNKGKQLNEILTDTLSPVGAKIIFAIYAVFFILRIMGGLIDTMDLVLSSLSVVTNWIAFIVPMLIVIGFNVLKGARNVGRLAQIFFFFIFISVLLILFLSYKHADFSNLQPYVADGFGVVAKGALNASFWFSDCVFLVFLMGSVTTNKLFGIKISGAFVFGAILTVMLDIVFLSLFGMLAQYSTSALAKVSGFNLTSSSYGRLDWIFVVIWLSSIVIKSILFLWAATMSISYIFNVKSKKGYAIIYGVICLAFIVMPLILPLETFIDDFICQGVGKYFFFSVQYLIPLLLPLLTYLSNKKSKPQSLQEDCDCNQNADCMQRMEGAATRGNGQIEGSGNCLCKDGAPSDARLCESSGKQDDKKGLFNRVKRLWKKITAKKA